MKTKSKISKSMKINSKHKKSHSILEELEVEWRKNLKTSQLKVTHGMRLVETKWLDFPTTLKGNQSQQLHHNKHNKNHKFLKEKFQTIFWEIFRLYQQNNKKNHKISLILKQRFKTVLSQQSVQKLKMNSVQCN